SENVREVVREGPEGRAILTDLLPTPARSRAQKGPRPVSPGPRPRKPLGLAHQCLEVCHMAHFPKPFFRADRRLWYVQLDGKQHNLGPDRTAAFARYHDLMSRPSEPASDPRR